MTSPVPGVDLSELSTTYLQIYGLCSRFAATLCGTARREVQKRFWSLNFFSRSPKSSFHGSLVVRSFLNWLPNETTTRRGVCTTTCPPLMLSQHHCSAEVCLKLRRRQGQRAWPTVGSWTSWPGRSNPPARAWKRTSSRSTRPPCTTSGSTSYATSIWWVKSSVSLGTVDGAIKLLNKQISLVHEN